MPAVKPETAATITDARDAALALLSGALRSKRAVDEKFDALTSALERRDRAFVRLLVATALRRLGQIDGVLARFVNREPLPLVQDALRLGTAQALFLDTAPHAAVATTVELVKRSGQGALAGFVNAVMRKVTAEGKAILAGQDAANLNTPAWLRDRWAAAFGDTTATEISSAHLLEPPLDLTLKKSDDTLAKLIGGEVLTTGTIRLRESGRIENLPGFEDGDWWVQDAAAALPAKILLGALGGGKDKTIADLCAAPGGKTLQLAASRARVFAVDNAAKRLALLKENLLRTKLNAEVITADAKTWQPPVPLDGVLLDAPCSAT
ncbi:MAG: MFS transporter, partial [Rhodobacteraceae bacterium]|nr:MFS transporter [Paracoccaceae bacterium]